MQKLPQLGRPVKQGTMKELKTLAIPILMFAGIGGVCRNNLQGDE